MNFFAEQARARRRTVWLLPLAAVAMGGTAAAFFVMVRGSMLWLSQQFASTPAPPTSSFWDPAWFAGLCGGACVFLSLAWLWHLARLQAGGGEGIALALDGTLADPNDPAPERQRLRNVVEEMAVASGLPVPAVYVLEHERAINAFAAGWTPASSVIGDTAGACEHLDRSELQGVVAHEFSHIVHGDTRLNMYLSSITGSLETLSQLGRSLFYLTSRVTLHLVPFAAAALVMGSLGVFFSRMMQAAVSRQREYLADATAVQFTRYPAGLAGALKKVGGFTRGSRIRHYRALSASHLFIAPPRNPSPLARILHENKVAK